MPGRGGAGGREGAALSMSAGGGVAWGGVARWEGPAGPVEEGGPGAGGLSRLEQLGPRWDAAATRSALCNRDKRLLHFPVGSS